MPNYIDDTEEPTQKIQYKEYLEEGPLSQEVLAALNEAELNAITANAADELANTLSKLQSLQQTVDHARRVMRQTKETMRIRGVK